MLRTITIGAHSSVQGVFVQDLKDGRILVRVGDRTYTGNPVTYKKAA
ncbi:translation initiation factor 2 [Tropicimonas marinistellae]|nr:translation initiation factor 2 [Tropicimonas marinistellae]